VRVCHNLCGVTLEIMHSLRSNVLRLGGVDDRGTELYYEFSRGCKDSLSMKVAGKRQQTVPIMLGFRTVKFNRSQSPPPVQWPILPLVAYSSYLAVSFTESKMHICWLSLRRWFGGGACVFIQGAILSHYNVFFWCTA
jgi:hypothetical protein